MKFYKYPDGTQKSDREKWPDRNRWSPSSQKLSYSVVLCMKMSLSEEKSWQDFQDKLIALFLHVYTMSLANQEEAVQVIEANCEYWRTKDQPNLSDEVNPTAESEDILVKQWMVEKKTEVTENSDVESNYENASETLSEKEKEHRMEETTENVIETNEIEMSCSSEQSENKVGHSEVAIVTDINSKLMCKDDLSIGDGGNPINSCPSSDHQSCSSPRRNTGEVSSHVESHPGIHVHNQGKKLSCDLCEKPFVSAKHLTRHLRLHKERTCPICARHIPRKDTLDLHMKIHQGQKDIVCEICDYRCYLELDLQRHMRTSHTREKPFVCDVCSVAFRERKTMKKHKKAVHEKVVKFFCDQCDYQTHLNSYLNSHKANVHDDQREKFTCELCSQTLRYKEDYLCHVRAHRGERTYKCTQCDAAFFSTSSRSKHTRNVHLERLHSCDVCSKKFSQRSHLRRHLVVHTGAKEFSCPACSYCCNLESNLRKHCKEQHGITYPPLRQIRLTQVEENIPDLLSKYEDSVQ